MCRTSIVPTVARLASVAPRSVWLSVTNVCTTFERGRTVGRAGGGCPDRSPSAARSAGSGCAPSWRSGPSRRSGSAARSSSARSARSSRAGSAAAAVQQVAGRVEQAAEILAAVVERLAQLVDHRLRSSSVSTEFTSESMLASNASAETGIVLRLIGMISPPRQVGRLAVRRDQVDVLLADHRAVGHRGGRRRPAPCALLQSSMLRSTRTPVVDQVQRADPADRDAAVGDLGVGEDAARIGEIGVDRARVRRRTGP